MKRHLIPVWLASFVMLSLVLVLPAQGQMGGQKKGGSQQQGGGMQKLVFGGGLPDLPGPGLLERLPKRMRSKGAQDNARGAQGPGPGKRGAVMHVPIVANSGREPRIKTGVDTPVCNQWSNPLFP